MEQTPILTYQMESKLKDGIKIRLIGETFEKPIFQIGEQVYSCVKIQNIQNGTYMGMPCYLNPMEKEELEEKVKEIAENPEPLLFPIYR